MSAPLPGNFLLERLSKRDDKQHDREKKVGRFNLTKNLFV